MYICICLRSGMGPVELAIDGVTTSGHWFTWEGGNWRMMFLFISNIILCRIGTGFYKFGSQPTSLMVPQSSLDGEIPRLCWSVLIVFYCLKSQPPNLLEIIATWLWFNSRNSVKDLFKTFNSFKKICAETMALSEAPKGAARSLQAQRIRRGRPTTSVFSPHLGKGRL